MSAVLSHFAARLIEHGHEGFATNLMLTGATYTEYRRGVHEAGGGPRPRWVRVLTYHAIADLDGPDWQRPFGVTPGQFSRQIDTMRNAGYHFVGVDEFLRYERGQGSVPRRPILLTFDDCYESLLTAALPILRERAIPAIAFAVTGYLGGTNEWDQAIGGQKLRLLDASDLHELSKNNVEIGAHSRTHPHLCGLSAEKLSEEIAGSVADLEAAGLPRPRFFAYPHGEQDSRVRQATKEAGLQAAFTVDSGYARAGEDPFMIPRTEILRGDNRLRFRWKLSGVYQCLSNLETILRVEASKARHGR